MGVSSSTLRFYDKEGLLPFVNRVNGRRVFKDEDFGWLRVINCLKNTGMPIREIREYISFCMEGDGRLRERQDIILRQKAAIEKQIESLQENLKLVEEKARYYEEAVLAGTEQIFAGHSCNPALDSGWIAGTSEQPNPAGVPVGSHGAGCG